MSPFHAPLICFICFICSCFCFCGWALQSLVFSTGFELETLKSAPSFRCSNFQSTNMPLNAPLFLVFTVTVEIWKIWKIFIRRKSFRNTPKCLEMCWTCLVLGAKTRNCRFKISKSECKIHLEVPQLQIQEIPHWIACDFCCCWYIKN